MQNNSTSSVILRAAAESKGSFVMIKRKQTNKTDTELCKRMNHHFQRQHLSAAEYHQASMDCCNREGGTIGFPFLHLTYGSASRYPFYMLGSFNMEWKTLTWLRYTIWIPLYPLGAISEGELGHLKGSYSMKNWLLADVALKKSLLDFLQLSTS